jgi:prepilin-type N-terminal cleavage/methylation domain-containing protein
MLNNIKKRNEGFTIIEVLIVLAIAGLILLVVFLAVPALQRNSRNTQRRTEASNYLAAVSEWSNNNGGKVPVSADMTEIASLVKLSSMKAPTTTTGLLTGAQTGAESTVTIDQIYLVTGAKCATGGDTAAGSTRQFAVRYVVETGGSNQKQCTDS